MWTINKVLSVGAFLVAGALNGCGSGPSSEQGHVLPIDPTKVEGTWKVVSASLEGKITNHDSAYARRSVGEVAYITKNGFRFDYIEGWAYIQCANKVATAKLVETKTFWIFTDQNPAQLGRLPDHMYELTSECSPFQKYLISDDFEVIVFGWDGLWVKAKRVK